MSYEFVGYGLWDMEYRLRFCFSLIENFVGFGNLRSLAC